MKLKYLWVEKYKNLQDFECNFSESGLDVLIGTNGSGKVIFWKLFPISLRDYIKKQTLKWISISS